MMGAWFCERLFVFRCLHNYLATVPAKLAHSAGHQSKTGKKKHYHIHWSFLHWRLLENLQENLQQPPTKKKFEELKELFFEKIKRAKEREEVIEGFAALRKATEEMLSKKNEKLEETHLRYLPPGERGGSKKPCGKGKHQVFVSHAERYE